MINRILFRLFLAADTGAGEGGVTPPPVIAAPPQPTTLKKSGKKFVLKKGTQAFYVAQLLKRHAAKPLKIDEYAALCPTREGAGMKPESFKSLVSALKGYFKRKGHADQFAAMLPSDYSSERQGRRAAPAMNDSDIADFFGDDEGDDENDEETDNAILNQ